MKNTITRRTLLAFALIVPAILQLSTTLGTNGVQAEPLSENTTVTSESGEGFGFSPKIWLELLVPAIRNSPESSAEATFTRLTLASPAVTGSVTPSTRTVGVTPVSITGTATANGQVRCIETAPDGAVDTYFTTANSAGNFTFGPFVIPQLGTYSCRLRDMVNGSETTVNYSGSGNFSVSVTPSSRTINPGQSASYTATFSSISGFAGVVTPLALNWSNVPNATASWSNNSVNVPSNGSAQATFTINTSSNTTGGTYGNIILQGRNGSVTRSASAVSLTVNTPTVNLTGSVLPANRTVGVTQVSIVGNATPGATVTENETNPDGTTGGPFTTTVNGSGNYTLGPFIITQLGTYSGTLRDSISGQQIPISYSGSGDFSASVNVTSRTINAGQSANYTVTFTSVSGFTGIVTPIALNWAAVPNSSASWSPLTVTVPAGGSAQTTFTIQTAANTTPGTYGNITLSGKNGSFNRSVPSISLTVNAPTSNLTGSVTPPNRIVGVTPVRIVGTATADATVRCTETAPDNVVSVFTTPVNSSGNYEFGPYVIPQLGNYNCVLRDMFTGQELSLPYSGSGDFGASVNPTTRNITRGQSASYTVTFNSLSGFGGLVKPYALNWASIPGTNASWSPSQVNVPPGGSAQSTFTIQTSAATTPGTYGNITLFGKNGSFSRNVQSSIGLTVNSSNPAPTITQPISPSSVPFNQVTTLTVNGTNFRENFNAFVGPDQIAREGLTFVNSSQVRVQVRMLGAPPYNSSVRIVNDDGQSSNTGAFSVTGTAAAAPVLSNITPSPVTVNLPTTLTVTGSNFVNKPMVQVIVPNEAPYDIAPSAVTFDSANQIRVQVEMRGTPPYQATLKVKNPDQQSANREFSVAGTAATLEMFGLEVSQGIQSISNNVEVIEIKPTWVRAHVKVLQSLTGNVVARARLVGRRPDGTFLGELAPINNVAGLNAGSIVVKSDPQRAARNDSFLFSLPAAWTTGTVDLQFEGITHNFVFNEPDGTHDGLVRKTFNDTPTLRINLVKVSWGTSEPTDQEMARVAADLLVMLPAKRIEFKFSRIESPVQPTYSFEDDSFNTFFRRLNLELMQKRNSECVGGSEGCTEFYLGIISPRSVPGPPNGTFGYASTINDRNCSPERRGFAASAYFFPVDHRLRYTHVHEFGHLLGRFHSPYGGIVSDQNGVCTHPFNGTIGGQSSSQFSPGVVWGFNGQFIFNPLTPDVMSYGDYNYVSRFSYEGMLQHIRSRFNLNRIDERQEMMIQQGEDTLLISGNIGQSQQVGSLSPIYQLPSPIGVPNNGAGISRIVYYDSANNQLANYPFEPESGSAGNVGLFALLLPKHQNATRISLVRNAQELAFKQASASVPIVTITAPNGGETLNGDSTMIAWTASDADSDQLSYLVQFSGNNGATWTTLASNLTVNQYAVNLDTLPGTSQGRIRVLASDGFHTAQDQSDGMFTIAGRGPIIDILTPTNNSSYVGSLPVMLQGTANDLEDGELSGASLKWISNLDGQIGTGQSLSIPATNLTEGVHTITLSGQDSGGFIGTESVSVAIYRSQPIVPASLLLAPSAVSFLVTVGSGVTNPKVIAVRNDGDGDLNWSAAANQSWIQLGNTSGTAPSNLSITVNAAGLSVGTYTGEITITTNDAPNSPQIAAVNLTIVSYPVTQLQSPFDFDGDSKTDLSIFRPTGTSGSEWWWMKSSTGGNAALQFGTATDKLAPVDFTGDGKTDVAFWRPSSGQWFVLRSEDFSFYAFPFGTNGDVPAPADYDGDGRADAAVFRESSLTWFISKSSGGTDIVGFGAAGDKPVNADFDGDGKADIAIFRPTGSNGAEWWIRRSSNASVFALQFGASTDNAVPGDFTGDGKADVAFWRPSTGFWNVLRSEDFSYFAFPFGANGDIASPGDYDGDGKIDAAVYRPTNSTWYANRTTGGVLIQQFGINGDVPLPSSFVR